ncbi:MAG: hypothetical protein E7387_03355 [Ruminococcaceae bacterium]|nr:hypothetical protein [Oscillospiraceae bacterium]
MVKRVLISFLSVLMILILATGVFSYFINICDTYLSPENSSADMTVDYMFAVDADVSADTEKVTSSQCVAVVGKNKKADKYYCTLYSSEGKLLAQNHFGADPESCIIHDIRTTSKKISILCLKDGMPVLYCAEIPSKVNSETLTLQETLTLTPELGEDTILKLLLPDSKAEFIAVAAAEKTFLYDTNGQIVREYSYSPKNVITSGVYNGETFVLCGADSALEDGEGFSYGSVEAFDNSGKSVWSREVYRETNCVSAVTECQFDNDGNLLLYGSFYDYSKSDLVMTTLDEGTIDDFKIYGHGNDYHVYTPNDVIDEDGFARPSVFIAKLDMAGNEKNVNVYSVLNDYRVPSISQEKSLNKLNSAGEFVLTSAQAASLSADTYFLTIDGVKIEIPCNIQVIYDVDNSGGIFAYLAESSVKGYNIKYFKSAAEFSKGMEELRKALSISRILDYAPTVLPWGLICVVAIILLVAKHKWRNIDCE